jgi:hypothetical protein
LDGRFLVILVVDSTSIKHSVRMQIFFFAKRIDLTNTLPSFKCLSNSIASIDERAQAWETFHSIEIVLQQCMCSVLSTAVMPIEQYIAMSSEQLCKLHEWHAGRPVQLPWHPLHVRL